MCNTVFALLLLSACSLGGRDTGAPPSDTADTGGGDTGSGESGTDTSTSEYGQAVPFRELGGEDAWMVNETTECDTIYAAWVHDESEAAAWQEATIAPVSFPPGLMDSVDWSAEDVILAYINCPGEGWAIDIEGVWDDHGHVTVEGTIIEPKIVYTILSRTFAAAAVTACDACVVTQVETTIVPAP